MLRHRKLDSLLYNNRENIVKICHHPKNSIGHWKIKCANQERYKMWELIKTGVYIGISLFLFAEELE